MKQRSLEQTIIEKVNAAKEATQKKLFKQFVSATNSIDREAIGAKMNVLDSLMFELIKSIREGIQ